MVNLKDQLSSHTNNSSSFFAGNKLLLGILAGIAAGVVIARLIGTEKVYDTLSSTANDLTNKAKDAWDKNKDTIKDTAASAIDTARNTADKARVKAGV